MKNFIVLFFMFLLAVGIAGGVTHVSGPQSGSWTLAGSPFIVDGNVTINSGNTLTIDSAVIVRFTVSTGLYVYGTLNARYTLFTSSKDTVLGTPAKGDWDFIDVGIYYASGTATLNHCTIKFGGVNSYPSRNGNVYVNNGTITLTDCNIINSKNYGILFEANTNVTLTNSTITSCDWPIVYGGQSSLVFNGTNNLTGNVHDGIPLGFTSISSTFVLDTINIPYVFTSGTYTVNTGATLTIAPNNMLKFGQNCWLVVNGTLVANAGPGKTIYFTAYTDDNVGGDTNGDGTATIPGNGYWGAVQFTDGSIDASCVMRRCQLTFGGYGNYGAILLDNASPTIDRCTMENNYYGIMMRGVSSPVFTNNTIGSSVMTPIAMSMSCNPDFSNNTFSFKDNTYDAIGLLGGTLPADAVIPIRSVTSIPNVVYVLLEGVTVPVGRVLTINKGVILKGISYWNQIVVQGKILANGTADSNIVITSIKDDNLGGDTNKDGTATSPGKYDWGGIFFDASSDPTSTLNYCRLKYGYVNGYGGLISMANASPIISHCEIKDVVYGIFAYQSSNPQILNDTITNASYTPIAMSVSADPVISGVYFLNPGWNALGIISENLGLSGTIRKRNVAGFTNITYVLLGDLTISNGTNVTVEPGVVIKMNDNTSIWVNGGFRAKGTVAGGQIIFTSLRDDNAGNPGDTNGDGQASQPGRGNWYTIRFQATSDDVFCLLDSCQIKYAGGNWLGGVSFEDASGSLKNSLIINSSTYGVRCDGVSIPAVNNVTISSCGSDPIAMSLKSDPLLTNITFAGNGSQGIRILEGTLSSNAYLRKRDVAGISNIAYIIQGLTISANAVLTIEPGVVIKSVPDYYSGIWVNGALVAEGTATKKIVFTSIRDDSKGGDTNNDGNGSAPERWNWTGIAFYSNALDSLNSLKNCEIRYGGSGAGGIWEWGEIRYWGKGKVDSCAIEQTNTSGIGVYGSGKPDVKNSQINNASQVPISLSMFSTPTFTNMSAQNVAYMALGVMPESYSVDATIPKRDFAGYTNITYMILDNIAVNSGTTITIPAGVVFKGGYISVSGGLIVKGIPADPVVFTSVGDDLYGNPKDTQSDGFVWPSIWGGYARIYFSDISNDANCSLRNTIVRYTETGVYMNQASPKISNCKFDRVNWGVYLDGISEPKVDSCVFNNLDRTPIFTSILAYPSSTVGNVISGTTWRGIRIKDETLSQDFTLPKRSFAGINNIPYIFGSFTIGTSAILTLEPGVVIKFDSYGALYVHKGLIAEGGSTTDSTIVFTSLRDDFYGGDTNGDGNASGPWFENWASIQFLNDALDAQCRLKHCVFRYGGYYWNGASAVYTNSASPTITNCSFSMNRNGIYLSGASNPVIQNCDIYQCEGLDLSYISGFGIYNTDKSFNVLATYNWWGDDSGPYHATLNPGGKGVAVSDSVNFIPFTSHGSLQPKLGDVSLNGSIQAYDASLVLKHVVGLITLSNAQKKVANVSGDTGISAYDASLILQYVVGLITTFPAEGSGISPIVLPKQVLATSIEIGNVQSNFGSTVTIPVRFKDVKHVSSADLVLKFNSDIFTPKEVQLSGQLSNMSMATKFSPGEIRIAIAGSQYVDADGDVIFLTFNVAKEIRGTVSSSIAFTKVSLNEQDFTALAASNHSTIIGKPTEYVMAQNFPNPFNPSTTIRYQVPDDGAQVTIRIYNSLGELVKTLIDKSHDAGSYDVAWDGTNDVGAKVGSGIYFYKFSAAGGKEFTSIKKMLLVK